MSEEAQTGKKKSKLAAAIVVLAGICLGSGAGVGVLYYGMKDDIEAKARGVFHGALAEVLGEAEDYPVVGEYPEQTEEQDKVYMNQTSSGVLYAALGTAQGYQSQIRVLVSVKAATAGQPVGDDPAVHTMTVVESQETPGLGENIKAVEKDVSIWGAVAGQKPSPQRPRFQDQFSGKRLSDLVIEKRADTDKIAAVTGATITSTAATEAVRNAVKRIIEKTAETYGQ
ncbi:MAG: FMN-binding protein [Planctomycetota bacterium]|jgi:Na+-translocating ferredoxin:NAD+ oxidoreductase RnfG subunit